MAVYNRDKKNNNALLFVKFFVLHNLRLCLKAIVHQQ